MRNRYINIFIFAIYSMVAFGQVPISFFPNEAEDAIETIEYNDKTLVVRTHFKNSEKIKEEYIAVTQDTFLYRTYDSLTNKILREGLVSTNSDSTKIDSIPIFDPETYEEGTMFIYGILPVKQGKWHEADQDVWKSGSYINGKKEGTWQESQRITNDNWEAWEQVFEHDSLMSQQQLNLAISQDSSEVYHAILGKWGYNQGKTKSESFFYRDGDGISTFTFTDDGEYQLMINGHHGGKSPTKIHKWKIEKDMTFILENDQGRHKYKLIYLDKYTMVWEDIAK